MCDYLETIIDYYFVLFGKNLITKLASANTSATRTASTLKDYTHSIRLRAQKAHTARKSRARSRRIEAQRHRTKESARERGTSRGGQVSSGLIVCQNIAQTYLLITEYRVMLLIKYTHNNFGNSFNYTSGRKAYTACYKCIKAVRAIRSNEDVKYLCDNR